MNKSETSRLKPHRDFEVNMSSEAITSRLREVGELNQLGMSLAKAKPYPPPSQSTPSQSTTVEATNYSVRSDLGRIS